MPEEAGAVAAGGMTPYVEGTPYMQHGERTSEYQAQTPGVGGVSVYEAAFSPGANVYASPGYASPNALYPISPVYGSPASPIYGQGGGGLNKVQSPIYGNAYASPIY